MNVEHVPAFYGAFDRPTCIAELRPAIADTAYTAEFVLTQRLRVLDLTWLDFPPMSTISYFERDYRQRCNLHKSLLELHGQIRKPVLPNAQDEYMPTQLVAEYLSSALTPRIEAVLFGSAQRAKGRNIVVFRQASSSQDGGDTQIQTSNYAVRYVPESLWWHNIDAIQYRSQDFPYVPSERRTMLFDLFD
jgi:hypothetical protein